MKPPRLVRSLLNLLRRAHVDRDMRAEMQNHLDLQAEKNVASGMSADEALHAARRQFGGVTQIQEQARAQRFGVRLEHWWKDFVYAFRSLRRTPAFSVTVFLTLALCLGPNTAVLSVLYSLLWKPLPFPESERIMLIQNLSTQNESVKIPGSFQQMRDYQEHADKFERLSIFSALNLTMGEDAEPVRATGFRVTENFFELVGLTPERGRFFHPAEFGVGGDRVLVLSHSFWTRNYGADPAVVGRTVRMGGETYTIVGIAPARFEQAYSVVDYFKPFDPQPTDLVPQLRYNGPRNSFLIGRLKPGVTPAEGVAQLDVLERRFLSEEAAPQIRQNAASTGLHVRITALRDEIAGIVKTPLLLLQGGAVLVLLIGCINVANLLLARANVRRPELAVRHALGASHATLLRQMLLESFVLAGFSAAAGIALAFGAVNLINRFLPALVRGAPPLQLDLPVLLAISLTAVGIATVVGTVPFLLVHRSGLRLDQARSSSSTRGSRRFSSTLVVAQVALALALLAGTTLLVRSLLGIIAVDPGFDATHLVQGRVAINPTYAQPEANRALQQRLLGAFRRLPGVESVALTGDMTLNPNFRQNPCVLRQAPGGPDAPQTWANLDAVSTGFFETMGIRVLEGREFNDGDNFNTSPIVIVDEIFAARYFPGRSALGQELVTGTQRPKDDRGWSRIVGVVSRAQLAGREKRDGAPFLYVCANQMTPPGFTFVVRSKQPAAEILTAMRTTLRSIDSALPLYATGSLATALDDMLLTRRAVLMLLGVFAVLALLLAGVGLYGVLAYDVSQRTRELGVRAAIGASHRQIIGLVLRQGLRRTAIGLLFGIGLALLFAHFLRSQLFDVTAADPVTYLAVCAVLLGVAFLASWLPARRAAKVDPMKALRAE